MAGSAGRSQRLSRVAFVVGAVLTTLVVVFAARRVAVDVPNVSAGRVPTVGPDREYALHPWPAYVHIALAMPYLLLAPVQLWPWFRGRHIRVHRAVGRTLVALALVSVGAAVVYGLQFPVGGVAEAAATTVFSTWFAICLVCAVLAIRRGDVTQHRRWMIRAYLTGLAVGTIRVWVGLFSATGLFDWSQRFALGFWLAFLIHVGVAEWWLAKRPSPPSSTLPSVGAVDLTGQTREARAGDEA